MKLMVFSHTGYSAGIASYLSSEGHTTEVYINASVPYARDYISTSNPDIAVFDSNELVIPAEWCRTRGVRVLGTSQWSKLLDTNVSYKSNIIKAIGYKAWTSDVTGIDVVVCLWFNGQRFISTQTIFNYTRMMPGDVGVKIDSAGYIAYFDTANSHLAREIGEPLEKFLRKVNHRGYFSVDCVVTQEGGIFVKDVSADISKPYTQALFENSRKSRSDLVIDVLNDASQPIPHIESCVCGVMLSVYPYPNNIPDSPPEVLGLNSANLKHIWKMDFDNDGAKWTCGHINGCLGYVTARGKDHFEAARRVYRTIANIKADNMQYRNDIGRDTGDKLHTLKKLNII